MTIDNKLTMATGDWAGVSRDAAWWAKWDKNRAELDSVRPDDEDINLHAANYYQDIDDWHGEEPPWDRDYEEAAYTDGYGDDEIW